MEHFTVFNLFVQEAEGPRVGTAAAYLCEAQLGCMKGEGTLFSSWMMVSLSVDTVTALVPLMEPFHLNSPAAVMQNLWERWRLLSWSCRVPTGGG